MWRDHVAPRTGTEASPIDRTGKICSGLFWLDVEANFCKGWFMSGALGDRADLTSPGFDTLDPSEITGDTLVLSRETHGFDFIRTIVAPGVALAEDALYTLIFKVATPWKNLPGSSNAEADGSGWITMNFAPSAGVADVQITAIKKDGSTAGNWIVFA